jgi:hypothetical protein
MELSIRPLLHDDPVPLCLSLPPSRSAPFLSFAISLAWYLTIGDASRVFYSDFFLSDSGSAFLVCVIEEHSASGAKRST